MILNTKLKRLIYKLLIGPLLRCFQKLIIPSVFDVRVNINVLQDIPTDLYRSTSTFNQFLFGSFTRVYKGDLVFVDVGVNVGQNLIAHMSKYPQNRYVGFDPNPASITVAENLSVSNGFHPLLISSGLSNKASRMTLRKDSSTDSECKLDSEEAQPKERSLSTVVHTDTLDSWMETITKFGRNWFIKIDVEGHERQVLEGMSSIMRNIRPIISCEILGASFISELDELRKNANLIESILQNYNYDIYLIDLLHLSKTSEYRIAKIQEIPIGLYSEMPGVTDYLFVPSETNIDLVDVEMK